MPENNLPSMTAEEYKNALDMAIYLHNILQTRNVWEGMGILMEGWCRGQNLVEIIGLAKAGQNELQILCSIYGGTVRKDLQEITLKRAAGILAQQACNAGMTTEDALRAATIAASMAQEAQRRELQARRQKEAHEATALQQ